MFLGELEFDLDHRYVGADPHVVLAHRTHYRISGIKPFFAGLCPAAPPVNRARFPGPLREFLFEIPAGNENSEPK
jgi:hypothetical protein